MKHFLTKLGITVAALTVVAYGLDLVITRNLRHSDARMFSTYNAIYSDSLTCDAVVMGSSRGLMQYDVAILDSIVGLNTYNISVDGRCIDAEVVIYDLYRQHAPQPRLVIQNIDYGTLQMSNGYEREQYLPYLRRDNVYRLTRPTECFSWADRYLPLVRYAGYHEVVKEGLGIHNKLNRPEMYKGYVANDSKWDGTAFAHIDTLGAVYNPEAIAIFDRYLHRCKEEGIRVVMVYAPIYIGVTEKMGSAADTMFAIYRQFADRYDYPILNYTFDSICHDTLNFYNASHLNRRGAELFSTKLAHDLKELLK